MRYQVVPLRAYTHAKHRTVDDTPYGGGAGMVLKPEPFFEAVEALGARPPIVLLSARGRPGPVIVPSSEDNSHLDAGASPISLLGLCLRPWRDGSRGWVRSSY